MTKNHKYNLYSCQYIMDSEINTFCISLPAMKVGEQIARIRELRGMTQPELSEACGWGFKQARVGHYENGRRQPKPEDLIALAKALSCTVGEFFGEMPSAEALDPEVLDVARRIVKLNKPSKLEVVNRIVSLQDS